MKNELPLLILGAGGHGCVLANTLSESGKTILGWIDANPDLHKTQVSGLPVLGDESVLSNYPATSVRLVNGLGSTGLPVRRQQVYEALKGKGYEFESVIHPTAILSKDAFIAEGAQVMMGAILQSGVHVGENTVINTGAVIDHDCQIGKHCHIAPGVTLSGGVHVGNSSHIGTGAVIIQSTSVGERTLVAPGAVVVANAPSDSRLYGVPAKERGVK